MKFKSIALAISASTVLLATSAFAQDGTIQFKGIITTSTCTVTGGVEGTQTVSLGTVSSKSLASAGQTAAPTPFQIGLTGCAADTKLSVKFDGTPIAGNDSLLAVTSSTADPAATNVGVGIYETNNSQTPMKLFTQSNEVTTDNSGDANFNFVARYVATGTATSGPADSSTTFSIMYN